VRRIRWAIAFGLVAALATGFGAAIFEVWDDGGAGDGPAAMARILRDGRVLVWIGFATAAGFVLAGRDTLTSSVDSLFEEDRRNWVRRVLLERESSSRDPGAGPVPDLPGRSTFDLPDLDVIDPYRESEDVPAPGAPGASSPPGDLPPILAPLDGPGTGIPRQPAFARRGPSSRLLTMGSVLIGAGVGAGLGALVGELAPGTVLGVVVGLLAGLLLDRGE
jgi:hypothetical protein